jgi:hypothetical protein
MKSVKLALLATLLATAPAVAHAQDAGAMVYSQIDDSQLGSITANDGTNVILDTGTYKIPLPANAFQEREGKWTINASLDMLNGFGAQQAAAAKEAEAKLTAALVDGAAVVAADAMPVGTVLAMDPAADQYLVANDTGVITLKREHFAIDEAGALVARFTTEQLAGFTVEVPEGAVLETPEGQMMRTADGWQPTGTETASAGAEGATGASM